MTLHFGDGSSISTFASLPAIDGSSLTGLPGGGALKGIKIVRNTSTFTGTSTGYHIANNQTTTFTVPEAGNYVLFHNFSYTFQRSSNQTRARYQGRVMKNGSEHYFWIGREENATTATESDSFKTAGYNANQYLTNLSANDTIEVRVEIRNGGGGTNTRTRLLSGGYMVNGLMKVS